MKLRKGKKVFAEYETAYDMAEDIEKVAEILASNGADIKEGGIEKLQDYLFRNAFLFAVRGYKVRLGDGWIIE